MTKQIVIKLNEKKFKPILDKLMNACHKTSRSYSDLVGKCLFFSQKYNSEEIPELDNKSQRDFILNKLGKPKDMAFLEFLKKYTEFIDQKS
ncbi:hypothetical protein GOV14_04345 [Candidatus Pacearchaeota archaeon]|nr:hypothetical protein [Candidatus Pacearchaeota archaeon]